MTDRAGLPAGALTGVRRRRLLALALDLTAVSILSFGLWLVLLIVTFGLSLVLLPPLFPFVAFFYNGLNVSGRNMATPGMRLMDLEMRTSRAGQPVTFLAAALHAVLFYFSWMFPPVFLWTLFSEDKRCLHDVMADVIVVRRI
ncbi:RDD family protein [Lichenihabitans sp. Uapishka_5]|nr:RDD family protein [Lichenihabitans sp. Uapishka_5]